MTLVALQVPSPSGLQAPVHGDRVPPVQIACMTQARARREVTYSRPRAPRNGRGASPGSKGHKLGCRGPPRRHSGSACSAKPRRFAVQTSAFLDPSRMADLFTRTIAYLTAPAAQETTFIPAILRTITQELHTPQQMKSRRGPSTGVVMLYRAHMRQRRSAKLTPFQSHAGCSRAAQATIRSAASLATRRSSSGCRAVPVPQKLRQPSA